MGQVRDLTGLEDYKTELQKSGLVVVDFYSTECPPCKVIAPFYEKVAQKDSLSHVRFFKINGLVEPGSSVQKEAGVIWWPTFVVYQEGNEVWRRKVPNPPVLQPVHELEQYLDSLK